MKPTEARYVKVASGRFFLGGGGGRRHFLDACFLCQRDITSDRHIFMYRGDAAFCSDECRKEQMEMDSALKAVARRHRMLRRTASSPASAPAAAAAAPGAMARRPTIAGHLAAHASVVSG
ncbi:hypothetical protein ACP4OV_017136 [Aristida adscensionis]